MAERERKDPPDYLAWDVAPYDNDDFGMIENDDRMEVLFDFGRRKQWAELAANHPSTARFIDETAFTIHPEDSEREQRATIIDICTQAAISALHEQVRRGVDPAQLQFEIDLNTPVSVSDDAVPQPLA